jgi:hypothetical protein
MAMVPQNTSICTALGEICCRSKTQCAEVVDVVAHVLTRWTFEIHNLECSSEIKAKEHYRLVNGTTIVHPSIPQCSNARRSGWRITSVAN